MVRSQREIRADARRYFAQQRRAERAAQRVGNNIVARLIASSTLRRWWLYATAVVAVLGVIFPFALVFAILMLLTWCGVQVSLYLERVTSRDTQQEVDETGEHLTRLMNKDLKPRSYRKYYRPKKKS
jgi:hypothetical protein